MALFGPISPEPTNFRLKGAAQVNEIQKQILANRLMEIKNQYEAPLSEAEIELKHGQAFENIGRGKNYLAEASTAPSRIKLFEAQTGHTNALTRLAPQEMALREKQLAMQQGRFGGAYQMARMLSIMPVAERAKWIAQNQEAYGAMMSELGNQAMPAGEVGPAPANALNAPSPGPANAHANALNVPPAPPVAAPQGMPKFNRPTPEQVAELAQIGNMVANKALTTAATERQMEGAIQVENIINDPQVQSQVIDASQYAGAARKGKAALDAFSQKNPAAYENYIAFKNQTMVLLQNRIKTLDQMGATDAQRQELMGLYSKTMDSLTSNPKQFVKQFNKLGQTLDTIARSVQKSASPVASVNRLSGYQPVRPVGEEEIYSPGQQTPMPQPGVGGGMPDLSGYSDQQLQAMAGGQ